MCLPIQRQAADSPRHELESLLITLSDDKYQFEKSPDIFKQSANKKWLIKQTGLLMKPLKNLVNLVVKSGTINFNENNELKQKANLYSKQLITLGHEAFNQFFEDNEAINLLIKKLAYRKTRNRLAAPCFCSNEIVFPWELFYPEYNDKNSHDNDPVKSFWGMQYPLGRNLTGKDIETHVIEQYPEANMLFGLYKNLPWARQDEWPRLKKLVMTDRGMIHVLGGDVGLCLAEDNTCDARELLKYLYNANHNMIHFACHCKQEPKDDSDNILLLSWVKCASHITDKCINGNVPSIRLSPRTFLNKRGTFSVQKPLVFLNACKSTGEIDDVTLDFNLPGKFVNCEAAAVIATICPVPDLFASAFANRFYELFLNDGIEIGEALRLTRLHFWEVYNNPLGLVYGLYSSPFYRVAIPLEQGGLI
ncbi:CHAT domain-containing protein [Desulfonema limicola]|nr:CHAT domain-containing protein [Desulfonema limicola]